MCKTWTVVLRAHLPTINRIAISAQPPHTTVTVSQSLVLYLKRVKLTSRNGWKSYWEANKTIVLQNRNAVKYFGLTTLHSKSDITVSKLKKYVDVMVPLRTS